MASRKPHDPGTPRVTLRVIAEKSGTSLTAASMALRNHPEISPKTRDRVQSIARKLGYRADPKLAALMQHLRTQNGASYHETIAYLSPLPYHRWKAYSQHDFYVGAFERAVDLGYQVEIFHLEEDGMTPERMSNLLQARGIRGLLIGAFPKPNQHLALDWPRFAAVAFSYSLISPALHRATTDYYREMLSTLDRLQQEGCKRIGLNVSIADDRKAFNFWRSAYLFHEDSLSLADRIPINATSNGRGDLARWVETHKPDAIISAGCDFPQDYEEVHAVAAPANIRYANMNIFHADARSRGIDQNSYAVGWLGCGHLVTMLQRNEIGLPEDPQTLSIEGKWVEDYSIWFQSLGKRTHPSPASRQS